MQRQVHNAKKNQIFNNVQPPPNKKYGSALDWWNKIAYDQVTIVTNLLNVPMVSLYFGSLYVPKKFSLSCGHLSRLPWIYFTKQALLKNCFIHENILNTCNHVYFKYLIFFTLPVKNSHTNKLSLTSTHTPRGLFRPQLSM